MVVAQLLFRVSAVHSMVAVSLLLTLLFLFLTPLLDLPHTAVGVEPSSHCCWSRTPLTLLLELNFPHTAVGVSSHCCWMLNPLLVAVSLLLMLLLQL